MLLARMIASARSIVYQQRIGRVGNIIGLNRGMYVLECLRKCYLCV